MYNSVNANINRTYNPNSKQNALCDIKRLLTSRDTAAQSKACGYLMEVINKFKLNSIERKRSIEYLLDNDITVFLCEATSNLDFSLFRSVLSCVRHLWRERRFFEEEHAAQTTTAVVRALAHYSATGSSAAVNACLHFICDLLDGISTHGTTPALSIQSAYSIDQLLATLNALVPRINTNPDSVLRGALVVYALISYQPDNLSIKGSTAKCVIEALRQWFDLLLASLNHLVLEGRAERYGMFLMVMCQIGMDCLRLLKLLNNNKQPTDFVQTILTDNQETALLKDCATEMRNIIQRIMSDLVIFVKDNLNQIQSEEYTVFLKLLLNFLYDFAQTEASMDFCDTLFSKGYLKMLPQNEIFRSDVDVRKITTLVLGEMLKSLAEKHLYSDDIIQNNQICANDIHLGLTELQLGIEESDNIGSQLLKNQPYCLLIYIFFYCQSCDKLALVSETLLVRAMILLDGLTAWNPDVAFFNIPLAAFRRMAEDPEEVTAPLLPHLVDHVLRLPKFFTPPSHIVKSLWLVFAMSTISNGSLDSLDERVSLEKATDRLVAMLQPDPSVHYTHNPAILFWAFTSLRIPNRFRVQVLSQWLKTEDAIPEDLIKEPLVWELLLDVLLHNQDSTIVVNCREALNTCLEEGDDTAKQDFATLVWSMLPGVLSKTLIDCKSEIGSNICYLLDMSTDLVSTKVDAATCFKISILVATIFSKDSERPGDFESKRHYQYVFLKLCLLLLDLSDEYHDHRVLLTYINRAGFLSRVIAATNTFDDKTGCAALQLLSSVVQYFTENNFQPKEILKIDTDLVIKSFRMDGMNERGSTLLQLVNMMLNSGSNSPLALTDSIAVRAPETQQCMALRALLFRIQLMLCCKDSKTQSSVGWNTLSSIFKHAVLFKRNVKLVGTLISQPWTHTLIRFQLTHTITEEFLTFTHNWLTLLKITIKKSQEETKARLSKYSLITRTLVSLKKNLVAGEEDLEESKQNVLQIVKEIIDETCVKRF